VTLSDPVTVPSEASITSSTSYKRVMWLATTPTYDSYSITVTGTLKNTASATVTFNLKITNVCPDTILTPPATPYPETLYPYVIT
jgi:hypothetical protein